MRKGDKPTRLRKRKINNKNGIEGEMALVSAPGPKGRNGDAFETHI